MKKTITAIGRSMRAHKFVTGIVIVVIIGAGYYWYRSATAASTVPQYVLSRVRMGSITQTVTGTGQVSAQNQLDVKSTVSGNITSIKVAVGDHVKTGDLLATVDSKQALLDLENARIAYAKLTQPAKEVDLSSAENNITKSYNDGYGAVSALFLDMPNIMAGSKDLLYGQNTFLSEQQSSYLISSSRAYRSTFETLYNSTLTQYVDVTQEYKSLSRTSATSSISKLIDDSYALAKKMAETLQAGQNAINFITTAQPDYQTKTAASAATSMNTWSNQINTDISGLLSAQSAIQNNTNTLQTLVTGADTLDIQSQRISLTQKEQAYQDYFIRAPFDGVVGRIPVNVYDSASGATIATIIGDNKLATISLNEVDAAKVATGQSATITFDAIDGFTATGTVSQVDLVGTVTQGVVTYTVKIAIHSDDPRIKPGMSVNTTIITKQKDNVLVVPSVAIKTQGQRQYVQIFENPVLPMGSPAVGSSTRAFASSTRNFASSTRNFASSTNGFRNGSSTNMRTGTGVTITSTTAPLDQSITIGDADDTNTEIIDGLTVGSWVVTKTITTGQTSTTAAPSLLSSLGGNRGGTGGATRIPAR